MLANKKDGRKEVLVFPNKHSSSKINDFQFYGLPTCRNTFALSKHRNTDLENLGVFTFKRFPHCKADLPCFYLINCNKQGKLFENSMRCGKCLNGIWCVTLLECVRVSTGQVRVSQVRLNQFEVPRKTNAAKAFHLNGPLKSTNFLGSFLGSFLTTFEASRIFGVAGSLAKIVFSPKPAQHAKVRR